MEIEQLQRRLDYWKQGLLVALGAAVTFFAIALAADSWFGFPSVIVGVLIFLATGFSGSYLLLGRRWRKNPLPSRLNIAFGYLGCGWLVLFSVYINDRSCNSMILISAFLLGGLYWYLSKKKNKPEEMFP